MRGDIRPVIESGAMSMEQPVDELQDMVEQEQRSAQTKITIEPNPALEATYTNHVNFLATPHEVFMDFYFVEPYLVGIATATHIARMVVLLSVLKGFRDALESQIANYERDGRVLPILRTQDQGDET